MIYRFLANVVFFIHTAAIAFVVFGCLAPDRTILWAHFIFIPLMTLHWWFNKNTCILTNLEQWLRGSDPYKESFIKPILEKILKRKLSTAAVDRFIYMVLTVNFLISGVRLVL